MQFSEGAVSRARAVFAAVGPVPADATIIAAIEAALKGPHRKPATAHKELPAGTPRRYLTRAQIMQVPCPLCGADPRKPCRRGEAARARVHLERMAKALNELPAQYGEEERAARFAASPRP
jgi:hypothetical protein